jgi:hypothetical protein
LLYDRTEQCAYGELDMNPLQAAGAFVVQFRSADPAGPLSGRLEHVASGKTAIFQSVQDLPAILRRLLTDAQEEDNGSAGTTPDHPHRDGLRK